ncbi:MAG: alpha/beta hydrolase [Kouleothrix sp.]|nr:alpha/beta hydrolase [Kouleothrix sp.]
MRSRHRSTVQHRRAQIGPVDIHYQVAGAGKPLVLIHGLSGSCRWWARNIEALARQFRVYVVDLVGFGESRNGHPFVLQESADYLARWMKRIGVERASVAGHSMGGFIASELAADHPEQVERLVLVDAAVLPFEQSYVDHSLSMLREARQIPLSFMPILFGDALRAGIGTIWKAANELLVTDLRPKLERIGAPTLVVWGERDAIIPLEVGRRLSQHLRYDELVVIKGAGHNPMWDCPGAFNTVIAEFMTRDSGAGHDRALGYGEQAQVIRHPRQGPPSAPGA